ncbi:ETC complex I subunit [Magnetospirillum sp. UT-4]|uniref:ETC complex I subunit n=1 Tax=Magnetospirillum sp. UT-4 TaxID=2681467 RepID=UPI001381E322|nr:ETC complex I subunit [Magnetospirillum sp. UT-4]CAA7614161.1 NADH-ubiquinone oxidoreductase family protein [Magnetospirillum sp. UT-4]
MQARIYRPAKTVMQSGRGNAKAWVLEFEPAAPKRADPLMGWLGSDDTTQQVRLKFASLEEAVAFARRKGLDFQVADPAARKPAPPKNYADNFRFDKLEFGRF